MRPTSLPGKVRKINATCYVRIPHEFVKAHHLKQNTPVKISFNNPDDATVTIRIKKTKED